ncbi:MAG TPA: FecR domain-containing protein [Blastocatellia bacterium]|nr:FecR domain-containing protein [Blastocatellia bacterium]
MKNTNQKLEQILNDIRHDEPDHATINAAADRVWARVANHEAEVAVTNTVQAEHLRDCNDFQSLIPAYLSKQLTSARVLLFEDHTRECFACRKELKAARTATAKPQVAAVAEAKPSWFSFKQPVFRYAMAATLVLGLGAGSWKILEYVLNSFRVFDAVMMASNGPVYRVSGAQNQLVNPGEKINRGERLRTAKGATAILQLSDGTQVEMAERSEVALTDNPDGTTINLNQGNVIVEAAKQKNGKHLYVKTDEALVSVVGTIFSVNNGTKGARVSVVEGEVHVEHNSKEDKLLPGDQVTTNASIEKVAIKQEVSWSRNAQKYDRMLAEIAKLRSDIAAVPRPGVRNSTRILDVMPEGTVFYVALPNLTETLNASYNLVKQRVESNPELNAWMNKRQANEDRPLVFADKAFTQLREFGSHLGEEITMSFELDAKGEPNEPLFVADLKNADALRAAIEQLDNTHVQIVDDPTTATAAAGKDLFIWMNGNLLAASPKLDNLQRFAVSSKSESNFKSTSFYASLAKRYQEGTSVLVSADLDKITPQVASVTTDQKANVASEHLGLTNFRHLIAEIKDGNDKAQNSVELTFKEANKGIASWLAAPAPMGALNYISADANVVGSFVIKDPKMMADNIINALKAVEPKFGEELAKFESEHGINVRDDIAAPLGGEFAFALDGPLVPTPSWKLIVEVYDQARMQATLERIVNELNRIAQTQGKQGFTLTNTEENGQKFYVLKSLDYPVEVNYAFVKGYWIATPSKALIDRAMRYAESGSTLLLAPRFIASLPADKQANFSAMLYQNLAPVVNPIARNMGNLSEKMNTGEMKAIATLANSAPSLAYAYSFGDRITLSVNTENGALNLGDILGGGTALSLGGLMQGARHK